MNFLIHKMKQGECYLPTLSLHIPLICPIKNMICHHQTYFGKKHLQGNNALLQNTNFLHIISHNKQVSRLGFKFGIRILQEIRFQQRYFKPSLILEKPSKTSRQYVVCNTRLEYTHRPDRDTLMFGPVHIKFGLKFHGHTIRLDILKATN